MQYNKVNDLTALMRRAAPQQFSQFNQPTFAFPSLQPNITHSSLSL
jgi:hypothetical protein